MPIPFLSGLKSSVRTALSVLLVSAASAGCGGGGSAQTGSDPGGLPTDFIRQTLDTRRFPDAVCNDGSPGIFYIQRGQGAAAAADANKTVIHLQGGGFCLSDAECSTRAADQVSSTVYGSRIAPEGLLSGGTENARFRGWNRVSVPYCSSDFFSGDIGPTGGSTNFRFRGAKILAAVVQTLNSQYDIGKAGDTVVLSGSSAGAVGAFINANRVRALLPGASVLTLIDAGVYPDIAPPFPQSSPPNAVRESGAIALGYWNGQVDADCAAANAADPGLCYLFEHAQSTLKTPFFVAQNAKDGVGVANVGLLDSDVRPDDPTLVAWINDDYLPAIGTILSGLGSSAGQGVFATCDSPAVHTLSTSTALWERSISGFGGRSLETTFADWVAAGAPAVRLLASRCSYP